MKRLVNHARSNAVAYAALFVALGGSSYAAVRINGSQIQNRSINPRKAQPAVHQRATLAPGRSCDPTAP